MYLISHHGQALRTSIVAAALALCGPFGTSRAVEYTNASENDVTPADDALIQDAFWFVNTHQQAVFDRIDAFRSSSNIFGYTGISTTDRNQWKEEVDRMADGEVKIDCNYNKPNNKCGNKSPGLLGWTNTIDFTTGVFDQVNICVDNVRSIASNPITCNADPPGSAKAIMAGVIAHELMHHVDGLEDHGPDKLTNPCSLDSKAETIGLAMEHLALTPDFAVEIGEVEVDWTTRRVTLEAEVTNTNEMADVGIVSTSAQILNGVSPLITLLVDDREVAFEATNVLGGMQSQTLVFDFTLAPLDPDNPVYNVEVVADSLNVFTEIDEDDNSDTYNISAKVDLAIDVEIAGEPVERTELRVDLVSPQIRHWFDVTYVATVRNLNSQVPAPAFNVQLKHRDPWSDSGVLIITDQVVPGLEPGRSTDLLFTVEVPAFREGTSGLTPSGSFSVTFIIDPERDSVKDTDLDNNSVAFVINDEYWKPDYQIIEASSIALYGPNGLGGATLRYTVKNIGPVPAERSVFLEVFKNGATMFTLPPRLIAPLGVGEEIALSTEVTPPECEVTEYTVSVDSTRLLDESNNSNNSALFEIGQTCNDPDLDIILDTIDVHAGSEGWDTRILDLGIVRDLGGTSAHGWIERQFSAGPKAQVPADFRTRYRHSLNISHDFFALVSQPAYHDVSPLKGSTPPPAEPTFLRGDPNGDDLPDISDAISTLDWLFLGGKAPACEDAADFNDDGVVDLSDAVAELGFLFTGGPGPSPPGSRCGLDPTPDKLRCRQTCER